MTGGNGTLYEGPVVTTEVRIGGRTLALVRPGDPDRLLEEPGVQAWNKTDDYMPYWAYLWPGAFLLADAVAREPIRQGIQALEIGCGLGLAGLVGLTRGLSVRFTDYDRTPLEFVARSARANGIDAARFSTAVLDWRFPPDERFKLILGADVLYEPRLVVLVSEVLDRMLDSNGLALIAGPYRAAAEQFGTMLETKGLRCEPVPLMVESTELGLIQGTLYRVTRENT